MSLPEQDSFLFTCEPECSCSYQQYKLFKAGTNPVDKVIQACEQSSFIADHFDRPGQLFLQALDMNEANVNIRSVYCCLVSAFVDAWRMNGCAASPGFMDIHPGPVKTSEIIYHRNHEFEGKVGLQVKALKTFDGIGRRVGF